MKFDLHVHSKYSYDSFSEPSQILKVAKKRGLDGVAITDHDSFRAHTGLKKLKYPGMLVIPGTEIKTDRGDVIGLFIDAEIKSKLFEDVVKEIADRGGISVLPHPYRRKCDPAGLTGIVDLLEVVNSRSRTTENEDARALAHKFHKKAVAGSDAHNYFEIGMARTEIHDSINSLEELKVALLTGDQTCKGKSSPYLLSHGLSLLSSRFKRMRGIA